MIDADTDAFADFIGALRMPKESAEQKTTRHHAIQNGLKKAVNVPLSTMRVGDEAWGAMVEIAKYGNIASKSDVQVGARALEAGIWGAWQNVLINMSEIDDEPYKATTLKEAEALAVHAKRKCSEVREILNNR